jgi:hypothetical protein
MKLTIRFLFVFATLLAALAPRARALPETEATAGRLVLRRFADAIVSVKLTVTLKMAVNGRSLPPNEIKVDANATVITPAGLAVTSLNSVDPTMIYEAMRVQMTQTAMSVELDGAETKGLRLRLADGTEIPVRIAAKDPTRDLAFLVPENPAAGGRTFAFVDLRQTPDSAAVLGDCCHLVRLNEAMQRTPVIRPGVIVGIIERPRRLLLVSTDAYADGIGCPLFDAQGRVLGICLRYVVGNVSKGIVVVPAAEVADQAPSF